MLLLKYKIFTNIFLTNTCNFLCNNCALWSQDEEETDLAAVLAAAENSLIVNLCGGNPLLANNLPAVLKELKQKNKKVFLTMNGLEPVSLEKNIYHYIDLPIIYLPALAKPELLELTGLDSYAEYQHLFDYFAEQQKKYLVFFTVNELNLEELPELYDLICRQKKGFLLLYYRERAGVKNKKDLFLHLKYYAGKKSVFLIKAKQEQDYSICGGVAPELEALTRQSLFFFIKLLSSLYL